MSSPEFRYEIGQKYPYDDPHNGRPRKAKDWAVKAARGVVSDLLDRRNIKWGFENIDLETRKEIIDTLAEVIRTAAKEA